MSDSVKVSLTVLKCHPQNQEYFDNISGEDYERFKHSIKEEGIIHDIVVAPDMTILSGHQRFKAAQELGFETVSVQIREDASTEDQKRRILLAANFGRMKNSPAKQRKVADEYTRLCGYSANGDRATEAQNGPRLTLDEIASQLGTTRGSLKRMLRIERGLSEPMKQLLDDGVISETVAADVVAALSEEEQLSLITSLDVAKKYTAQEVRSKVGALKSTNDSLQRQISDLRAVIKQKEQELAQRKDESLAQELAALQSKCDALLSQQAQDKKKIEELRKNQYSEPSRAAQDAYELWRAADKFVKEVLSPFVYDVAVTKYQNAASGEYISRTCNLLINAATDVLRRFETDEVIDAEIID